MRRRRSPPCRPTLAGYAAAKHWASCGLDPSNGSTPPPHRSAREHDAAANPSRGVRQGRHLPLPRHKLRPPPPSSSASPSSAPPARLRHPAPPLGRPGPHPAPPRDPAVVAALSFRVLRDVAREVSACLGGLGRDALRDLSFASLRKKPAKEAPKSVVHVLVPVLHDALDRAFDSYIHNIAAVDSLFFNLSSSSIRSLTRSVNHLARMCFKCCSTQLRDSQHVQVIMQHSN